MNIIKKIYDFVAKPFSKHFWWAIWLEFRACFYKSVDSQILDELCGYINPSYFRVLDLVRGESPNDKPLLDWLDKPSSAGLFYNNPVEFLDKIRPFIIKGYGIYCSELYDKIEEICSPTEEKFLDMVRQAGLEGRVMRYGESIWFTKIKIIGDIDLPLGGAFEGWNFDYVKFCDDVFMSIYPSGLEDYYKPRKKMSFSNNICCGTFACSFALVPRVCIRDSVFMSYMNIGVGVNKDHLPFAVCEWLFNMTVSENSGDFVSTVEFSSNYVKEEVCLFDSFSGHNRHINMANVRFTRGNVIGGLSTPSIRVSGYEKPILGFDGDIDSDGNAIGNIDFSIDERIVPLTKRIAVCNKTCFVALKNWAIEKHDREEEFKYGRQERYFDWCLTNRLQDNFIFLWSCLVSNSGLSWFRPAVILLGGQWLLAAIFIGKFGGCGDYVAWFQAAVESLNPLSSLPDIAEDCKPWNDSLSASIYNAVRRIFSLALLYEVKVINPFSVARDERDRGANSHRPQTARSEFRAFSATMEQKITNTIARIWEDKP